MNNLHQNVLTRYFTLIFLLFSFSSQATNFNYTNLEVGFTSSPSSITGSGRIAFSSNTHLIASGATQFKGDWLTSIGAGFHAPINDFFDIYGDAQIYSIKFPHDDKHDFGELAYAVNVGARGWIAQRVEMSLLVGQIAFDANDVRSVAELGARFHNTEAISIGMTYRANGIYKRQLYFNVRFEY